MRGGTVKILLLSAAARESFATGFLTIGLNTTRYSLDRKYAESAGHGDAMWAIPNGRHAAVEIRFTGRQYKARFGGVGRQKRLSISEETLACCQEIAKKRKREAREIGSGNGTSTRSRAGACLFLLSVLDLGYGASFGRLRFVPGTVGRKRLWTKYGEVL